MPLANNSRQGFLRNSRNLARQTAYLQIEFPDLIRDPALLMACEIAGHMARPEGLSDKEQDLLWKLAHDVYDELLVRKSDALRNTMPAIGLAWQTTPAGSETVLTQIKSLPEIQAPLAYFLGLRCLAKNDTTAAKQCFSVALKLGDVNLTTLSMHETAAIPEGEQ